MYFVRSKTDGTACESERLVHSETVHSCIATDDGASAQPAPWASWYRYRTPTTPRRWNNVWYTEYCLQIGREDTATPLILVRPFHTYCQSSVFLYLYVTTDNMTQYVTCIASYMLFILHTHMIGFCVAQQQNPVLDLLIFVVARWHTRTPGRTLWTNDRLVAEAATHTVHNKHDRRTYIPSSGFEPAIPAIERSHT